MVWWALVKLLSLGYLLGLVSMSLAALFWHLLRPRIAVGLRADAGFGVISGTLLLNTALAVLIWLGVVGGRIRMTTNYFHALMCGPWGLSITVAGGVLLLISLALAWLNWRRGFPPQVSGPSTDQPPAGGVQVHESESVPTLSLVGAWRAELWVNPGFWRSLSLRQQALALHHERIHLERRDNLRRLALMFIGGLYNVLPWARRWAAGYELDCELAVDDRCRTELPEQDYVGLVARATEHALGWRPAMLASHLAADDIRQRLAQLKLPRRSGSVLAAAALGYLAVLISVTPAAALLLNPVSRCLYACYLGY